MKIKFLNIYSCIGFMIIVFSACNHDPNSPRIEYTPDMYRSPAIEAYVDYGRDPWLVGDSAAEVPRWKISVRQPAVGTILFSKDPSKAALNFPYPYSITPEGYEQAGRELKNPIPWSEDVVKKGGEIFGRMCAHCHGATGQGDGTVIKNSSQGYAVPRPFNNQGMIELMDGQMFHSISYGKNIGMGAHASQLSKEERWMIIHYIRTEFQGVEPASDTVHTMTVMSVDTTSG